MQRPLIIGLHPLVAFLLYACLCAAILLVVTLIGVVFIGGIYGFDTFMELASGGVPSGRAELNAFKIILLTQNIGLFIIPALAFAFIISPNTKKFLHLKNPSVLLGILCLPLMFFLFPVINWLAEINAQMVLPDFLSGLEQKFIEWEQSAMETTEGILVMDTMRDLLLNVLIIGVFTAIGEELCFRGVIQKLLAQWTKNIHLSVWITGFIFSIIHFQFYGFLPRFILGVLLGYLLVWSGSIWLPIFIHFLNNASAVVLTYFIQKGKIDAQIETAGAEGNWFFVLSSFLIVAAIFYLFWKKSDPQFFKNYTTLR